jgi:hypothetical protein
MIVSVKTGCSGRHCEFLLKILEVHFLCENSAVLQTIRACLPKVDGMGKFGLPQPGKLRAQPGPRNREQTYSNSELRVNTNLAIKP